MLVSTVVSQQGDSVSPELGHFCGQFVSRCLSAIPLGAQESPCQRTCMRIELMTLS